MLRTLKKTAAVFALLTAALGLASAAHATEGWYGRIEGGYSFDGEIDFDNFSVDPQFDDGWLADGAIGKAWGGDSSYGYRLEGELSYRSNDVSDPFQGVDTNAWGGMLNGYVDFNRHGKVQPYLGVGVGYGRVEISGFGDSVDDSGVAYQGMAGVGVALSQTLTLDIGYKYFIVPDLSWDIDGPFDGDYKNQSATIGLRWQFAAPPPPPPPPPPPAEPAPPVQVCPAQDFKVYFEWDRSNLNAAANDTINAAAARAKACNVSSVHVTGYTDTSGSAKYNIGLSNRRAAVVADALVAAGIPASAITQEGLGETNLDKPTADGVKEPLNRRTAVTISFQ
jgi:outer membrane protein OmpA-like peptidoglycan-associated protein